MNDIITRAKTNADNIYNIVHNYAMYEHSLEVRTDHIEIQVLMRNGRRGIIKLYNYIDNKNSVVYEHESIGYTPGINHFVNKGDTYELVDIFNEEYVFQMGTLYTPIEVYYILLMSYLKQYNIEHKFFISTPTYTDQENLICKV